jgi:Na+/H+ antiporter NhaD/arsenite permease-like protein
MSWRYIGVRYDLVSLAHLSEDLVEIRDTSHNNASLTSDFDGKIFSMAALVAAAASNLFNNYPTALIAVGTIHVGALSAAVARQFAADAIVGCDFGPNLTTSDRSQR